jgi:hypothetical protein
MPSGSPHRVKRVSPFTYAEYLYGSRRTRSGAIAQLSTVVAAPARNLSVFQQRAGEIAADRNLTCVL